MEYNLRRGKCMNDVDTSKIAQASFTACRDSLLIHYDLSLKRSGRLDMYRGQCYVNVYAVR